MTVRVEDVHPLTDGWSVQRLNSLSEVEAEDFVNSVDEARLDFADGANFWSVRDGAGEGAATICAWPPVEGRLEVVGVWADEKRPLASIQMRVREWFDELRVRGCLPYMLGADWGELEPVRQPRELLQLHNWFTRDPCEFLGGFDPLLGIERVLLGRPDIAWLKVVRGALRELCSAYWEEGAQPGEAYGQAFCVLAKLGAVLDEVAHLITHELESMFNADLDAIVLRDGRGGQSPPPAADDRDYEMYEALRAQARDYCFERNHYRNAYTFAGYVSDLAMLGPTCEELVDLPGLIEAKERVRAIKAAATWRPSSEPSGRLSGLSE